MVFWQTCLTNFSKDRSEHEWGVIDILRSLSENGPEMDRKYFKTRLRRFEQRNLEEVFAQIFPDREVACLAGCEIFGDVGYVQ